MFSIVMRRCLTRSRHMYARCYQQRYGIVEPKRPPTGTYRCIHSTSKMFGSIVQFNLSDIGEGIKEVVVKEWYVSAGDHVAQFDSLCEVQSDKASVTITSRYDGIVKKIHYAVDDTAYVGQPLVDIEQDVDETQHQIEVDEPVQEAVISGSSVREDRAGATSGKVLTTPAVRRIAMEHGIDLSKVSGSGKNGRLMKEDVLKYIESSEAAPSSATTDTEKRRIVKISQEVPKPVVSSAPPVKPRLIASNDWKEPMNPIQNAMFRAMSESVKIPHFGYCDELDLTNLISLRSTFKRLSSQRGVKFSYMPVFLKAASLALTQYPIINSSIDNDGQSVTFHSNHNFGIAMDTVEGLLVPVIKSVQSLSIFEIAEDLNRLQELGSRGKLSIADLSGSTFSLSNIGSIGGTYTKPVIFAPTVAIGAIGKIQRLPRYDANDSIYPAHICQVSWSADHRILDGATVARFSNLFKEFMEHPATMMLDLR